MALLSAIAGLFQRKGISELPFSFVWPTSRSGFDVTPTTAIEVSTVQSCVRAISEGVAQVPLYAHSRDARGVRGPRVSHPVLDIIAGRPNQWQSPFEFRETLLIHMALTGNAFVWKNVVGGRLRELIPIEPHRVFVDRKPDMSIEYTLTFEGGQTARLTNREVWHLRGPSWNTWMGLNAVKVARESIGLAQALEASHASMHGNTPASGGLLSMAEKVSPDKFNQLGAWLDKHTINGERAGKPLILDGGAKWTPTRMTGVDMQHIESRQHQVLEICRHFRVQPMMVGATETPTYASAEQMMIHHVVHCLTPWAERIEQSATANLTDPEERIDFRHDFNSLMRGDSQARSAYYANALGSGGHQPFMTLNEVRAEEGYDPVEGGDEIPEPTQQEAPGAPGDTSDSPEDQNDA
jgi:HK97 family phage portal protein